ncbi:iron donor protein CyaY [Chitinibacteraceae bacterium HSL-7]
MNESEFLALTDAVFSRIEQALDEAGLDVDTLLTGNVLEIEFDDGSKVIVNRHAANQELWIAAKHGGFHYRLRDKVWTSTRGDGEFFAELERAVALHAGEAFTF